MKRSDIERAWTQLLEYQAHVREVTGVPGLAIGAVWLPERLEMTAGFGVRKVGEPALVTPDTVFPLASVSKPMASTVVAMLVAAGHLYWWQEVPDLGLRHPPSYAQLFAHRSGLPDHAGDTLEDLGYSRAEVLARLPVLELNPGAYAYTNFGLTAAAEAAAAKLGKSWEDVAQELYTKLGMNSTSSRFADFEARENRTWGHRRARDGSWYHDVQRNADGQSPAGGVSSTVKDLLHWLKMHLGDPSSGYFPELAETHQPYVGERGYGLGWNVTTSGGKVVKLGHSGAFELGAGTCVSLWPQDGLAIVALTNGSPIGVPEGLCEAFWQFVNQPELTAKTLATAELPSFVHPDRRGTLLANVMEAMDVELHPPGRWPAGRPLVPEPNHRVEDSFEFVGMYASDFCGEVQFELDNGKLIMRAGPGGRERFVLTPTPEPNVFVYDSRGENGTNNNRVEFARDPARVTIGNLFASYPAALGRCPLSGVIRAWAVGAKRAGRIALTIARPGVDGLRVGPSVDVVVGRNRFANAELDVRAGDLVGFRIGEAEYWQVETEDFSIEVDIDREGTFVRV